MWLARELPVRLLWYACGRLLHRLLGFPKWLLKQKAVSWDEVLVLVWWRAGLQLCQSTSSSSASKTLSSCCSRGFLATQCAKVPLKVWFEQLGNSLKAATPPCLCKSPSLGRLLTFPSLLAIHLTFLFLVTRSQHPQDFCRKYTARED